MPYSMTSSSLASDGRHSTANLPGSPSAEPRADSRFASEGKPFIPDDGQVALGGQHEYGRCDDDTETRDQFAYAGLGHGKVDCCEVMIHRASDQSTLPSSFIILHRRRQTQSVRRDWRGTKSRGLERKSERSMRQFTVIWTSVRRNASLCFQSGLSSRGKRDRALARTMP